MYIKSPLFKNRQSSIAMNILHLFNEPLLMVFKSFLTDHVAINNCKNVIMQICKSICGIDKFSKLESLDFRI